MKRMIKNLVVFLSLSGAMVFMFNLVGEGLGKRWDELGLVILLALTFLLILDYDK